MTTVIENPDGTYTTVTNGVERHTFTSRASADSYASRRNAGLNVTTDVTA